MLGDGASDIPVSQPARSVWRRPIVWFGFALSVLAITTFVALFDMKQVSRTLLRASLPHVALAAGIFLSTFIVRSLRWKILLVPLGRLPFAKVRDALVIGYMANLLLPARMGEVARALTLWRTSGVSRRGSLTSIAVARLMDSWILLGLLVALGLLVDLPPAIRTFTTVFVAAVAVALVLVVWVAFHEPSIFWLLERAMFFLPATTRDRVVGFLRRFAAGSHALRRPALVGGALLATAVIWSMEYFIYLTMLLAFDIQLPAWAPLLAMLVTNLGKAATPVPGAIGVFEAACSGGLIAIGLDPELALSYAIGVHLMMYVSLTGAGQILMWRLGLKISDITQ